MGIYNYLFQYSSILFEMNLPRYTRNDASLRSQ